MICRLRGRLCEHHDTHVVLDVQGVCYQVFVPPSILPKVLEKAGPESEVELVTYHYQQLEVGKGFSILIGFTNEVEREFFERFITVSGVGPKAALKAMTLPISEIAQAIDEGNVGLLKSLRGIGEQRAKEIVAKLQGKVGKFALIQGASAAPAGSASSAALEEEAVAVLLQLEYHKPEAKHMVKAALSRNPKIASVEELLNEVYRQRQLGASSESSSQARPLVQQSA